LALASADAAFAQTDFRRSGAAANALRPTAPAKAIRGRHRLPTARPKAGAQRTGAKRPRELLGTPLQDGRSKKASLTRSAKNIGKGFEKKDEVDVDSARPGRGIRDAIFGVNKSRWLYRPEEEAKAAG